MFKEHITKYGKSILYVGNPNLNQLDELAEETGDLWHSGLDMGYKNALQELVYFATVYWWYINDFLGPGQSVNWRMPHQAFAIRKEVWEQLGGFDPDYQNPEMQGLDFAYNALRSSGAVPLYCKDLFKNDSISKPCFSRKDLYVFYRKNFKTSQSFYMLFRRGFWNPAEWMAFFYARNNFKFRTNRPMVKPRTLNEIQSRPTVSYIIPTMFRQEYTLQLLDDLSKQSYLPSEVVIVDATPETERDESLYQSKFPFELLVKWQTTKGSCRARNEAIELCTGDYIIFGDDDIRVPADFVENHLRFLQTNGANACNGLDIRAEHQKQNLNDLKEKLDKMGVERWKAGATMNFSNANSCVKRSLVNKLFGNDINFDGGYGEDADFGLSLAKMGETVLFNPFSANLHLKPPTGGYRWWGLQAGILGKKRKQQPWEIDTPVKWIKPVPSPTIMYFIYKHFTARQLKEYKYKYFFLYLFKKNRWTLPLRILNLPFKWIQFNRSQFYAKMLMKIGVRHK